MSIGTYATVAGCQARMTPGMSSDDVVELGKFCDQVNTWLETTTGRVLAPIPGWSSTLTASVSAGADVVTCAGVTGLSVGDVILFDLVTASPHESALVTDISGPATYSAWAADTAYVDGDTIVPTTANGHYYTCIFGGTTDTTEPTFPTDGSSVADGSGSDTVVWQDSGLITMTITLATTLEDGYASGKTVKRVYVYDGWDAVEGGRIFPIGRGIRRIVSLEVSPVTAGEGGAQSQGSSGGGWFLLPRRDYWIRTTPQERTAGWPATALAITNIPTAGNSTPLFFGGSNNVRIDADLGWPSVLPDVVGLAERVVIGLWQMRASGGAYPTFPDGVEMTVPRLLSVTDWALLKRYTYDPVMVI